LNFWRIFEYSLILFLENIVIKIKIALKIAIKIFWCNLLIIIVKKLSKIIKQACQKFTRMCDSASTIVLWKIFADKRLFLMSIKVIPFYHWTAHKNVFPYISLINSFHFEGCHQILKRKASVTWFMCKIILDKNFNFLLDCLRFFLKNKCSFKKWMLIFCCQLLWLLLLFWLMSMLSWVLGLIFELGFGIFKWLITFD